MTSRSPSAQAHGALRELATDERTRAILEAAEAQLDRGQFRDCIDLLADELRRSPSTSVAAASLRARHIAFRHLGTDEPGPWPPESDDAFAGVEGLPEVDAGDLTPDLVASGILRHGCLIVRGLVPGATAARLVDDIDRSFEAHDAAASGRLSPEMAQWFVPFEPGEGYSYTNLERYWTRQIGGVLAADSPVAVFDVIEALDAAGLRPILEAYLGEPPVLSVKKFTLRRAPADAPTEWHQDGSFLGATTRTVNLWLALSDCGVDAPSMDIFGRRFDDIVPTGGGDAMFDWSVGPSDAAALGEHDIVRPTFAPGDAVLFDQLTLHRTGVSPEMTKPRYAVEAWFFTPSSYPDEKIPIVL